MAKINVKDSVSADYKKFVESISKHATNKVTQAVAKITNKTNSDYSSVPADGNQIVGNPISYRISSNKGLISGIASANKTKELIYLEFGTRYSESDSLTIATGFKSGIDTVAIAAPYRSNRPRFINRKASGGTYYFLGNIDVEGIKFLRDFWK